MTKSRDKIFDLERDIDQAAEIELLKNEQLIGLRDKTREMLRNLSDLRSEITATRRAQIDMRRSMQQEVNSTQLAIIQQIEEYDQECVFASVRKKWSQICLFSYGKIFDIF